MNRLAILAALAILVTITTGAADGSALSHRAIGIAAVALALPLCVSARRAGIVAVLAGILACSRLGGPVAHACMGPVFLAVVVATAVRPVTCPCPPALRNLILAAPGLVLIQIVLGACYRHKILGVLPHMAGAMLVAGLLLVLAVVVLQRNPEPCAAHHAAVAVMAVVLAQVSLGIAAFVMRLLDFDTGPVFTAVATAHVSVGAMTLAASVLLAVSTCAEARNTQSTGPST